ncbi:MAG TPA: hypothetical protein VJT09_00645 [Pyrinomonadaceae bacterium]|nr:hypothetical protein [Pyrinomonadaceae bacterium]
MLRQLLLILGVACFVLLLGVLLINLRPADEVTINFVQGVEPQQIVGTMKEKDKYLLIKPKGSNIEQVFTWDKIKDISGERSFFSARFNDVYDVAEFITKLGALAAAGVFFIGLYQYEQGQQWKRADFLASTIKDIGASKKSENAKLMLDGIKLYPSGRDIELFPDKEADTDKHRMISRLKVLHSLRTAAPLPSDAETIAIRDCFDTFFSQLERIEQYIESNLITKEAVYTYMNYWIDLLSGDDSEFADYDRWYVLNYAKVYKFPKVTKLLERYGKFKEADSPPPDYLPPLAP